MSLINRNALSVMLFCLLAVSTASAQRVGYIAQSVADQPAGAEKALWSSPAEACAADQEYYNGIGGTCGHVTGTLTSRNTCQLEFYGLMDCKLSSNNTRVCTCFENHLGMIGEDPINGYPGECPTGMVSSDTYDACIPKIIETFTPLGKDSCQQPGYGNPIFPLSGDKREKIYLNVQIGGREIYLNYDSAEYARYQTGAGTVFNKFLNLKSGGQVSVSPKMHSSSFPGAWNMSLHESIVLKKESQSEQIEAHVILGDDIIKFLSVDGGATFVAAKPWTGFLAPFGAAPTASLLYTSLSGNQSLFATGELDLSSGGGITKATYADGHTLEFTYENIPTAAYKNRLKSVKDETGREVKFEYTTTSYGLPVIETMTAPDGAVVSFTYSSANAQLGSIVWPDATTKQFGYQFISPFYLLSSIADENGVVYAKFSYDENGNAVNTSHAGNVGMYSAQYASPPHWQLYESFDAQTNTLFRNHVIVPPSEVTVTSPTGQSSNLGLGSSALGSTVLTSQSQPAGSGCNASTSNSQIDDFGRPVVKDDFDGTRSCFAYDTQSGLVSVEVSGLPNTENCASFVADGASLPSGAIKRVSKYYQGTGLVAESFQPRSTTSQALNGLADFRNGGVTASCAPTQAIAIDGRAIPFICKKYVSATTDGNGSLGLLATFDVTSPSIANSYVYDINGRVVTSTDNGGRVTQIEYYTDTTFTDLGSGPAGHTVGDLQTITNPASFVTTFNSYDKSGRVLKMTDPKGIVTNISYTPRGWVSSVTVTAPGVAGRTTAYTYDNAGQLLGVANPDGTTVSYSYDAAHRLVSAKDARGNSVSYTLDNVGNKIKEDIKDPTGVLQRSIERSFDALNRLQQVSGAVQ